MKKIMMIAAMMLMSIGAFAQEGSMAVGAHLGYAGYGDGYSPLGLGARFQYEFVENIRGEIDGNYWFKKNDVGLWDANLNFHYLFPIAEDIKVYPLLGLTFMGTHGLDDNQTALGFNIGAGAEYYLQSNLKLSLDIKYQNAKKTETISYTFAGQTVSQDVDILKANGPVFQLGIAYVF
jgi:outer membrane protein X